MNVLVKLRLQFILGYRRGRRTPSPVPGGGIMNASACSFTRLAAKGEREMTWLTNAGSVDHPNLTCGCGEK